MKLGKGDYQKPELVKLDNLKDITFNCVDFSCSINLDGAPILGN